jgi:hypothetical protein
MGLLGEMLVERGAISVDQLHMGLAASRRVGQRLGTQLVNLGFIDERSLLEALAEQHGVPFVTEAMLLEFLESLNVGLLPEPMVRRLRAVPFRTVSDRIQVAMSNPGDARIIDRIANFTQFHVEPFVASDRTIEIAMDLVPTLREVPKEDDEELLTEVVSDDGPNAGWDRLWSARIEPSSLLQVHSRPRAASVVLVARFPTLEPVGAVERRMTAAIADDKEFVRLLGTAATAAEVGEILVHYSAQMLDRICVFAVHHGKISGWMGRGLPLDAAELRSFSIAASEPSLFREQEGTDSYLGPVPMGPVNDRLMQILGPPMPSEVLIVPLAMNGRVKGYLMGDIPGRSVPDTVRETLVPAGRAAGNALAGILRGRN